ncbi:MAG: helix-turn-helix transcriptional regulator [Ferruginibacter sp.]|nr:helix-turn-helix transcriptional regulator [Ferruginibacter sp.]
MFNTNRLKKLRKDLGLNQNEMGKRLNMEQSTYSKYETNQQELNLTLLQKLKDEFDVDPNEFIVTHNKNVHFETGSIMQGNGVVSENYYSIPKEIIDSILTNQQNIIKLINLVVKSKI